MSFGSNSTFSSGGAKGKNLNPGQHRCRVTHISVGEVQWPKDNTPRLMLSLHLETEKPSEDFVGFMIDQKDPSKGNYEGQVAYVKSTSWGYQDNKVKGKDGKYIAKEMLAAQFLHWLCINANESNWVNDNLGVHKTFEDFVKAFNKDNPIKDAYLNFTIGGTKEMKDNGYYKFTQLALVMVPKEDKALGLKNYTNDANINNLVPYNAETHIYDKTGGATVNNFSGEKTKNKPIEEEQESVFKEESDIDFSATGGGNDPFAVDAAGEEGAEAPDPFNVE
jgi:hypothetical protein